MVDYGYNYSSLFLGYFDSEEEAALAYNIKAVELYGEFAKLNIIRTDIYIKHYEKTA